MLSEIILRYGVLPTSSFLKSVHLLWSSIMNPSKVSGYPIVAVIVISLCRCIQVLDCDYNIECENVCGRISGVEVPELIMSIWQCNSRRHGICS
jgi:hypothetical protein